MHNINPSPTLSVVALAPSMVAPPALSSVDPSSKGDGITAKH